MTFRAGIAGRTERQTGPGNRRRLKRDVRSRLRRRADSDPLTLALLSLHPLHVQSKYPASSGRDHAIGVRPSCRRVTVP